jgi:signal transduction histidine kinase
MYTTQLDQWLFFIYFVYGLSFFGMGLAMALESGRSPGLAEARVLWPLAVFGVIHGAHEWFESYLLQASALPSPLPAWIPALRILTLSVSFPFLLVFAINLMASSSLGPLHRWIRRYHLISAYWLILLLSAMLTYRDQPLPGLVFWDNLARYMLAVPASFLAMLALAARSRQAAAEARPQLARYFLFAAVGFGVYAFTQLFVHPMDMFPANVMNQAIFAYYTGIPIQLVRTIVAVLITCSLIRATQVVEQERIIQLALVQQGRLEALQQREIFRRQLLQHTVQAQEDERARIAREIHDETAQMLTAFSLELAALEVSLKRQPDAHRRVETLRELSRQVSQSLYHMVGNLRPAHLDDFGLVPAMNYLLTGARSSGVDMELIVEGAPRRLDLAVETVLFRVAQEAITNLLRHSQAEHGSLRLYFGEHSAELTVADCGRGFNPAGPFEAPRGWGLEGMRERVEATGGIFTLQSTPGSGTTVSASIPFEPVTGLAAAQPGVLPASAQGSHLAGYANK